jgi:hypothetical protein
MDLLPVLLPWTAVLGRFPQDQESYYKYGGLAKREKITQPLNLLPSSTKVAARSL